MPKAELSFKIILLSIVLVLIQGCSTVPQPSFFERSLAKVDASTKLINPVRGYEEARIPLEILILNETNNGRQLVVDLRVTPQIDIKSDEFVLVLSGLQNGEVIGKTESCLSASCSDPKESGSAKILRAGSSRDLMLALDGVGFTDYRVDVLWGREAKDLIASLANQNPVDRHNLPLPSLSGIQLTDKSTNCTESGCKASYTLAAEIRNDSSVTLKGVTLGAGFVIDSNDVRKDFTSNLPEKEDEIPLPELYLQSNSSKNIEIIVEQDVPRFLLSRLIPNLRIVAHEYEGGTE